MANRYKAARWYKRKQLGMVCLALLAAMFFMMVSSVKVHAEQGYMKYMKGLKWDLREGRKYFTSLRIAGVGLKPYTIEMTKYKVTKPNRAGKRSVTYTLEFTPVWHPTKAQVHDIVNSEAAEEYDIVEGYCYNLQPDYYTGYDLEYWSDSPVTIRLGKWKESKKKYYTGTLPGDWYYTNVLTQTTTIYFPKSYKGLCIVVGTSHILGTTDEDDEYLDGDEVFGATSFYKNSVKSFHGIRVK